VARTETPPLGANRIFGIERSRLAGYWFGILTAACWAASPILIRRGLVGLPSPLWGVAIGLTCATAGFGLWMWIRPPAGSLRIPPWRRLDRVIKLALWFLVLAGLASMLGSIGRTVAIDVAPVVVVVPLVQTTSLWTIVLAPPLLGRHVERITPRLVWGTILVVGGAALVIVGQNT
jgi:drug/metabolite transporter (DMT)-like permease